MSQQLTALGERLRDLNRLEAELAEIATPVRDALDRHSKSEARLLETEALLARERENVAALRRSATEVQDALAQAQHENLNLSAEHRTLHADWTERGDELARLRAALTDRASTAEAWEREARAEAQKSASLTAELQAFRADLEGLEAALTQKTREIGALTDTRVKLEGANALFAQRIDAQASQITDLSNHLSELGLALQHEKETANALSQRLSSESAARQQAEHLLQTERTSNRASVEGLQARLDGALSRQASAEKLLEQTRALLEEKADLLSASDRALRTTRAEITPMNMKITALAAELEREREQVVRERRAHEEAREQAATLQNTLRSREALLESTQARAASLSARIEQLVTQHDGERHGNDAERSRLIEELQKEKSERAMAQGALDIARASRANLLQQLTALKRKNGASVHTDDGQTNTDDTGTASAASNKDAQSNVAFLHGSNPPHDR